MSETIKWNGDNAGVWDKPELIAGAREADPRQLQGDGASVLHDDRHDVGASQQFNPKLVLCGIEDLRVRAGDTHAKLNCVAAKTNSNRAPVRMREGPRVCRAFEWQHLG